MQINKYGTCREKIEEDFDLTLEYYMITEPLCEEYCDLLRYGAKIKMITQNGDSEPEEETSEIRDIFYRKSDAEEFMEVIMRNKVTPTGFHDIVKEYIQNRLYEHKK